MIFQALPFTSSRQIDDLMDKISNIDIDQSKIFSGSIDNTLKLMEKYARDKGRCFRNWNPRILLWVHLKKLKV